MKRPNMKAAIVLFVIMGVAVPLIFAVAAVKGVFTESEYTEEGRQVSCHVNGIVTVGRKQQVTVSYQAESGEWLTADCTPNKKVVMSEQLTGYVLPDDPYYVYCKPGAEVMALFILFVGGIAVGGWAALITALREKRRYDLIMSCGVHTKAQAASWYRQQNGVTGQFRIVTQTGREEIVDIVVTKGSPVVGEYYDVVYAEKPDGKLVAELTDEQLR